MLIVMDIGSIIFGFIILAVGVVMMRFYQPIADNFGSGVVSYDRFKLAALCVCGLGFILITNLHILFLKAFANLFFKL